jgi:hypothetical protein
MICFVETCYTYNPTLPLWLKSFDLFFVNMCLSLYILVSSLVIFCFVHNN